eukprot:2927227-Prorocentrum_lima.AAC.1
MVVLDMVCCFVRKIGRPCACKAPRMVLVLMWFAGVCMIGPFMVPHLWSEGQDAAVLHEALRLASRWDGCITPLELVEVSELTGMLLGDLEGLALVADVNGDGKLDGQEQTRLISLAFDGDG